MNPKEEIEKLKHGQHWDWPESDYGKAEIYRINDVYILFEIPQFGGEPLYSETIAIGEIDRLIEIVESWT